MSEKLLTISLKGASQSQPWVVINADSADEAASAIADIGINLDGEYTLLQAVAEANAQFQAVANVANPSGRAPAPSAAAGSGEPAQEAEATAPARQRSAQGGSTYGRRKAAATTGGRGGKKPKLTYEEASADCKHGERRRFTKPGADWVAYFCPQPKGEDECPANFLDASEDQEG